MKTTQQFKTLSDDYLRIFVESIGTQKANNDDTVGVIGIVPFPMMRTRDPSTNKLDGVKLVLRIGSIWTIHTSCSGVLKSMT